MEQLNITVNGKAYELLINEHESLVSVLRDRIQLTGTKVGCDQGSCGACTVLVNNKPVLSCITPALRYHESKITTIEGLTEDGKLHPLQEKFIAKGALQCGFCTPGMILTAYSFLKENPNPSINEIKEAISGNFCRCTGYKKIIEAIRETKGIKEIQEINGKTVNISGQIIGKPQPLIDAREKVTGKAEYANDIFFKDALYCKFLRSRKSHAVIESIDIKEALKIRGVRAIATGFELPEKWGVLPVSQDQTAMAIGSVRYIGEIVAAVAADTKKIANEAVKKIKVRYKTLPEFFTWQEAMEQTAPENLIHEHSQKHGCNIHKKVEMQFGDVQKDLSVSDHVCEMSFDFAGLNHAFTEPHACTAWWEGNSGSGSSSNANLTIITSTQVPHYVHRTLSKVLKTPLNKIRVIKPALGGGFGGKSDPFAHEIIAAYLAKKAGKPVKVCLSREEVFLTNHGRHPTHIKMKLGMDKRGKFKTVDADIVIDGGAFGSFGVVTAYYNGVLLEAPYQLNSFGFRSIRVYTNKPTCGAMRGHGAVNPRFAMEVLIDEIACRSKMDPCQLRFKNFLTENSFTIGQFRITSNGIAEALETVMKQSDWKNKFKKLPLHHGIGVACGFFISGSALPIIWNDYPQSVVHLKVDFDGRVVIYSGASDIGQGSDTMLAMVVAETLGISIDKTYVHAADTLFTPVDLGSYSSRVTFMAGNAAKKAAEKLKGIILKTVAQKKRKPVEWMTIKNNSIVSSDYQVDISWEEGIELATAHRGALSTSGYYVSPKLGGNYKGAAAGLSPSYSFGAVIAEVKVNTDSGQVNLINLWGAHDCGKALNPLAVEGQLEGSWHMGMGQAISEAMDYHEGLLLNSNLLDYKIPTSMDIPDIHTNIIESCDPEGPFGAKECGEGALHPSVPAIANAIYDAVGIRINSLPITAEKVLDKLNPKEKLLKRSLS